MRSRERESARVPQDISWSLNWDEPVAYVDPMVRNVCEVGVRNLWDRQGFITSGLRNHLANEEILGRPLEMDRISPGLNDLNGSYQEKR